MQTVMALPEAAAQAWSMRLDVPVHDLDRFRAALSAEERERAQRFGFEIGRDRFIASRGALRRLLGCCLRVEPGEIRLTVGPKGKPVLAPPFDRSGLRFNVAHSGTLALFALARGREVGVDVEQIRSVSDPLKLAERFFSRSEIAHLRSVSVEERHLAFLSCWTRKEAFVKAVGLGLSLPLHAFDVPLGGRAAAVACARWDPAQDGRWTVLPLDPGAGFVAALAIEGQDWGPAATEEFTAAFPECHEVPAFNPVLALRRTPSSTESGA